MEIINNRRSVRSFLEKSIADEKINLLVRAGMQAPTAKNQQANHFLVVRKKENLLKLANKLSNAKMLLSAAAAIIVLIDEDKLLIPKMSTQDGASATTTILIAATSLGLGSCWCGIYPNEDRMAEIRNILNIKDNFKIFSLIALGYPQEENALHFIDRYDESKILFD